MPSIKTTTPILGGHYCHLFNRGINRQHLFFQYKNYSYFLRLLKKYLSEYVDVLAYCLLHNHFHMVIRVKDKIAEETKEPFSEEKERFPGFLVNEEEIGRVVSKQLKRLFITYAMAINKQENRVGSLFDAKFKRLEITTQEYLEYVIFYTHFNPEKHGVISDFKKYKYSSFKAIMENGKTNISHDFIVDLYGGKDEFLNYHNVMHVEREAIIME